MCEQKFEQEQTPQTQGKKILWYIDDPDPKEIVENYQNYLEYMDCPGSRRIIYNNLRTVDEIPGAQKTCNRTEAEVFCQVEELTSEHCYILDHLHAVEFSTDMATPLSIGSALFHAASSRGADVIIIVLRSAMLKEKAIFWDLLEYDADAVVGTGKEKNKSDPRKWRTIPENLRTLHKLMKKNEKRENSDRR